MTMQGILNSVLYLYFHQCFRTIHQVVTSRLKILPVGLMRIDMRYCVVHWYLIITWLHSVMVFRKSKCFTKTHPQKPDHLELGLSISETHSQKPRSSWSGAEYLWKKSLQSVEPGNPCALNYTKLIRKAFVLSNCLYNFDSSSLFSESFKHVHFATSIRMVNSRTDFRLCSKENGSEPGALKMWNLWRPA